MTRPVLTLEPLDMTRDAMIALEERGLIHRLAPGRDVAGPVDNANLGRSIYESDARFGGHKLIVATIGAATLRHFGYHDDCEDVWLLGQESWRPLYFVFGACLADEFAAKARAGTLNESDLICLRVRYNDPEASFFVVKSQVPHGEFVAPGPGAEPSFYVTESVGLQVLPLDFGPAAVRVRTGAAELDVTP